MTYPNDPRERPQQAYSETQQYAQNYQPPEDYQQDYRESVPEKAQAQETKSDFAQIVVDPGRYAFGVVLTTVVVGIFGAVGAYLSAWITKQANDVPGPVDPDVVSIVLAGGLLAVVAGALLPLLAVYAPNPRGWFSALAIASGLLIVLVPLLQADPLSWNLFGPSMVRLLIVILVPSLLVGYAAKDTISFDTAERLARQRSRSARQS